MNRFVLNAIAAGLIVAAGSTGGAAFQAPPPTAKELRTGMEFIRIPAGTFRMGCGVADSRCDPDEKPVHEVRIAREFQIGKYEVTQAQWKAVMGGNPSAFKADDRPVENVSWTDTAEFVSKMNAVSDDFRYRLPSEAEWEYAARAGAAGAWVAEPLDSVAWFGTSVSTTMPVGQKRPNAWGLYDVEGNVWEWVQDWYDDKFYEAPAIDNPSGPLKGEYRVLRGGAWGLSSYYLRLSFRDGNAPAFKDNYTGFRVVREAR